MPRFAPLKNDFSGGEFSERLSMRVDQDRFKTGLSLCENWIPTLQGHLVTRPGTVCAAEVKDSTRRVRLIPFQFSTTQAYIIEAGHHYFRFYRNNALITETAKTVTGATKANPVVVTCAGHGYSNGDRVFVSGVLGMTQLNGREFVVANKTTNNFQLSGIDGTGYGTYTSGGSVAKIYEIATPYDESHLSDLSLTQSADAIFIAHSGYWPRTLTRTGHTSWTLAFAWQYDGPYLDQNDDASWTLTPSATTGNITVTANKGTFVSTDVGRLIRIKHGSTWGYGLVTSYSSSSSVGLTVRSNFASTAASPNWRLGRWSDTTTFPSVVTIYQNRLTYATNPDQIDASQVGDWTNFAPTNVDGSVTDVCAISCSLASSGVNEVRAMVPDEKGLLVLTAGSEYLVRPSSTSSAITPTDVCAYPMTAYGASKADPVRVGKSVIFVQRSGCMVRELAYFIDLDGFKSIDLTLLNPDIVGTGVEELVYCSTPIPIVWGRRTDGTLIGMTYERDFDVLRSAWHHHTLGGRMTAGGDSVDIESLAVIPSSDGTYDELWMIGRWYVDGAFRRFVVYMRPFRNSGTAYYEPAQVDLGISLNSPSTITGVSNANPCVITTAADHGLTEGQTVFVAEIVGPDEELNEKVFTVGTVLSGTQFQLSGVDSTSYPVYGSGGIVSRRVSSVTGLWHLNGETVACVGDGAVQTGTVSSGAMTLTYPASIVHVGIPFDADFQLLPIEGGSADGTALGKLQQCENVGFYLYRSSGLKVGFSFEKMYRICERSSSDALDRAVPEFTGFKRIDANSGREYGIRVCVRQDQPLAATVLAIMPLMTTQDK